MPFNKNDLEEYKRTGYRQGYIDGLAERVQNLKIRWGDFLVIRGNKLSPSSLQRLSNMVRPAASGVIEVEEGAELSVTKLESYGVFESVETNTNGASVVVTDHLLSLHASYSGARMKAIDRAKTLIDNQSAWTAEETPDMIFSLKSSIRQITVRRVRIEE